MPKKSSRRNTLSSSDLDSFLSEVTASDDQIKSNRRNTLSSDEILIKRLNPEDSLVNRTCMKDNENVNPNVTVSMNLNATDNGKSVNKTVKKPMNDSNSDSNCSSDSSIVEDRSNEQLIREFCKVTIIYFNNQIIHYFISNFLIYSFSYARLCKFPNPI